MDNKTKKISLVVGIIGLILIITGVTYAIFTANYIGQKKQQIVVGENFVFTYDETSNALSITNDDILSDTNGKVMAKYFDFSVKLKTQNEVNINYYIYLTKDEASTLDDSYIKLYLTDQNNTLLNDVTTINSLQAYETDTNSKYLYGTSITSSNNVEETHNYRLRVWVSDTYEDSATVTNDTIHHSSEIKEKTYKFTVNVATGEIPSNLANTWKGLTENELNYLALYTLDTVTLPETYTYNNETYTLDITIDVSEQSNNKVMLGEYKNGENIIAVIGQDGGVVAPVYSSRLFSIYNSSDDTSKLTTIDLSNFDTSNVTSMSQMFWGCSSLTSVDLNSFDTSNVISMLGMFAGCSSLTSLDLNNFDTSQVTRMDGMFGSCSSLTSLDLSGFDTSNVTGMTSMFSSCSSLTSLDLSNFNTSNVTSMSGMFSSCSSLTSLDLSNFNTSNVTSMGSMFSSCSSLASLDLNNFDTSQVTRMDGMFQDCKSLTEIKVGCNWQEASIRSDMFKDASVSAVTKVCNE